MNYNSQKENSKGYANPQGAAEDKPKGAKYPTQCWSAQNMTSTISLEHELCLPQMNDKFPPLTMHGLYSRFKLTMTLPAKADGKRDVIYYNIRHTDELAYFIQQYRTAKLLQALQILNIQPAVSQSTSNTQSSPAYTVVFGSGNKKGKTAAQFLMEGGDIEELKESAAFYAKNLEKYPNNQAYIDAIDDAIFLYDTGALHQDGDGSTAQVNHSSFVLIDEKNKYNASVKRDLTVTCVYGDNYPWKFEMAVHEIDGKKIKPGTTVKGSYALNDQQMAGLVYSMETLLNAYTVNMYPAASLMSKTMTDNLHGAETNVIDDAVNDALERMRPALINALKTYNKGQ